MIGAILLGLYFLALIVYIKLDPAHLADRKYGKESPK